MNGAEKPGAGVHCQVLGLPFPLPGLPLLPPTALPPFTGLGPHTPAWPIRPSLCSQQLGGGEEAVVSALWLPDSVCWVKERYGVRDRRALKGQSLKVMAVKDATHLRAETDEVGGGIRGFGSWM